MEGVLKEYIDQVIPRMLDKQYNLQLAKGGSGYEYLPEQSLFSHIINGVFAFSRLWRFLSDQNILPYKESQYRKFLSLYTTHDLHKIVKEKIGTSEFALSQEETEEEIIILGLNKFAQTNWQEHRAAMTHDRSSKQGDRLLGSGELDRLVEMVRVADTMASIENPREVRSLENHLADLSPDLALNYRLYFHELRDVRGILTNQIHQMVSEELQSQYRFYPLLFFASGIIYLGPKKLSSFDRRRFIEGVAEKVIAQLTPSPGSPVEIESGYRGKEKDFQVYIYSLVLIQDLLSFALDRALRTKDHKFYEKELGNLFGKVRKKNVPFNTKANFESSLDIAIDPKDKYFGELLHGASVYLFIVDSIVRDTVASSPDKRVEWLSKALGTPSEVRDCLMQLAASFISAYGGKGPKYNIPLAYHFLKGSDFKDRQAISFDRGDVLNKLHERIQSAFGKIDNRAIAQASLKELYVEDDIKDYLRESLFFSFCQEVNVSEDPFNTYIKPKGKAHSRICSLCARDSKYNMDIRTGILGDNAQEFSNRFLPQKATQKNRRWCPTCYLEFTFRSVAKLTPPPNIDRRKSARLYLYLLPSYSFTPEQINMFAYDRLEPFHRTTALTIRDYGAERPSHVHLWLNRRQIDSDLIDKLIEAFREQAEWIEEHLRKNGRELPGERLFTTPTQQLNYLLFVWERTAYGATKDDALIPTSSEMWAKATLAACLLTALTGYKVYVTERPYLPISNPAEVKPMILFDAPHNVLRGVLPGSRQGGISLTDLPKLLDLLAAAWQVNSDLKSRKERKTKDKHIAGRLEVITTNPLAGAFFYKQYARLNDDATPFEIYTRACQVLLEWKGGEMMDIAKKLADKSMGLFLPFPQRGMVKRGKAHTYEWVFRESVDALRKAPATCLDELKTFVMGRVLKALERRQLTRRGEGIVNPHHGNLNQLVEDFVELIVDEILVKRANSSIADFNRLSNSIADAVYFEIDRNVSNRFAQWKEEVAERKATKNL